MLPVNLRLSNRALTKFYYSATKRNSFGQCSTSTTPSIIQISRYSSSKATQSEQLQDEPLELADSYFNKFPSYCQMVQDAKSRARRSVLIDHCGLKYIDFKKDFDNIETIYSIERQKEGLLTRLSLVEFKTEDDAEALVKLAKYTEGELPVPLKVFRYGGYDSLNNSEEGLDLPIKDISLLNNRHLEKFNSYNELVYNNSMSLISLKLRFITLVNYERILCSGMFESFELMPFGSSIIDTGSETGDLDLIVTRRVDHDRTIEEILKNKRPKKHKRHQSNLIHLDKNYASFVDKSGGMNKVLSWFDTVVKDYMPLTEKNSVRCLSRARVPIVKFTSKITGIDCDLSFHLGINNVEFDLLKTNYSGIIISQLLYSICRSNQLFTAVVIYLRVFARLTGITSKTPNAGLSNFQLLSLIIFYLQQVSLASLRNGSNVQKRNSKLEYMSTYNERDRPILPSFKYLLDVNLQEKDELSLEFQNEDQFNEVMNDCLIGFMKFYSNFSFSELSLNLFEAKVQRKTDNSPLYVVNPFNQDLNIGVAASGKNLAHFVREVRRARDEIHNSRQKCPLILIRNLQTKYTEQMKKNMEELRGDLAQELCR